jgi:hypothetical protein
MFAGFTVLLHGSWMPGFGCNENGTRLDGLAVAITGPAAAVSLPAVPR